MSHAIPSTRSLRRSSMLVTVVLLGLACGRRDLEPPTTFGSTEPSSSTAIVHGPERSVEVLSDPARFVCEEAGQCVNSCGYGAVSAAWLARGGGAAWLPRVQGRLCRSARSVAALRGGAVRRLQARPARRAHRAAQRGVHEQELTTRGGLPRVSDRAPRAHSGSCRMKRFGTRLASVPRGPRRPRRGAFLPWMRRRGGSSRRA